MLLTTCCLSWFKNWFYCCKNTCFKVNNKTIYTEKDADKNKKNTKNSNKETSNVIDSSKENKDVN